MTGFLPYFKLAGASSEILFISIVIIIVLIFISILTIESKCDSKKIKLIIYIGFIIQCIIMYIDHFVEGFPTIVIDPRAFEFYGWFSYLNNVNIGRGEYNYWIINPIYKLLGIRVAIIFSAMNIFFTILINMNIYHILKKMKIQKKIIINLMLITVLSPISLIMKVGIQREAIIILFLSYSLKNFIEYCYKKNSFRILLAFILVGIAAIFHSGVVFLACGYLIYLLDGKGKQKIYQYIIFLVILIIFLIFKDRLLETVGGGDIEAIVSWNNYSMLKEAGSGYLQNLTTKNLVQIFIWLPFFIFYFLFSPTPNMFRGILDIATFILNSSLFIYLTFGSYRNFLKIRNKISKDEKRIIKALAISLLFTIIVFSIGTRNAGTAMRHRDKIFPFFIILYALIKNKYFILKGNKKNEKRN